MSAELIERRVLEECLVTRFMNEHKPLQHGECQQELARQPNREMLKRRKINRETGHGRTTDDNHRPNRVLGPKMNELRERRHDVRIGSRLQASAGGYFQACGAIFVHGKYLSAKTMNTNVKASPDAGNNT